MTTEIEEAIKLLKANGYSVIKKPEPVKLLPCVCGRKRISRFYTYGRNTGYLYKCPVCGLMGMTGKTEREAKILWNKAIKTIEVSRGEKDESSVSM